MSNLAIDSLFPLGSSPLSGPSAASGDSRDSFDQHLNKAAGPELGRANDLGPAKCYDPAGAPRPKNKDDHPVAPSPSQPGSTGASEIAAEESDSKTVSEKPTDTTAEERVEDEPDSNDKEPKQEYDCVLVVPLIPNKEAPVVKDEIDVEPEPHAIAESATKKKIEAAGLLQEASDKTTVIETDGEIADTTEESPSNPSLEAKQEVVVPRLDNNDLESPVTAAETSASEESQDAAALAIPAPKDGADGGGDRKRERTGKSGATSSEASQTTIAVDQSKSSPPVENAADAALIAREPKEKAAANAPAAVTAEGRQEPSPQQLNTPARFHADLTNRAGRPEQSAPGMSEVERARFVQRVARAFHAADEQGGQVRLRLSPPELGALRLEVTVRDGVMTARLETETQSAKNLLLDHMPMLRERLAEQNIRVERFEVDLMSGQSGGMPDRPGDQGDRDHNRSSQQAHSNRRQQEAAAVLPTTKRSVATTGNSQLNVVI
jgi:flagellar hook-length control protein FliK